MLSPKALRCLDIDEPILAVDYSVPVDCAAVAVQLANQGQLDILRFHSVSRLAFPLMETYHGVFRQVHLPGVIRAPVPFGAAKILLDHLMRQSPDFCSLIDVC